MPSDHCGYWKWQTPWFKHCCSYLVAIADGGRSSVLQVFNQLGYSSSMSITNDENVEIIKQVLNGNYILVFSSPEWSCQITRTPMVRDIRTFFCSFFNFSLSAFFASHLFVKGILCCVIRRTFKRSRTIWPFDHLAGQHRPAWFLFLSVALYFFDTSINVLQSFVGSVEVLAITN